VLRRGYALPRCGAAQAELLGGGQGAGQPLPCSPHTPSNSPAEGAAPSPSPSDASVSLVSG